MARPDLCRRTDVDQVPSERLLVLNNGDDSTALQPLGNDGSRVSGDGRALLLIHGTLSRTALPVDEFGADFIRWARTRYSHVLGFDHWTLSKSPEDNAKTLVECLRASAPQLLKERRLDIIAHSRGGLVARAFCDLLDQRGAVGQLVFLGTPNCGTDLGNPKKWGTLADVLVNMSGVKHADLFGRLAGLLARLAVEEFVDGAPGLLLWIRRRSPGRTASSAAFKARARARRRSNTASSAPSSSRRRWSRISRSS